MPFFVYAGAFFCLLSAIGITMIERSITRQKILVLVASISVFAALWVLLPGPAFITSYLAGFTDHIRSTIGLPALEQIAKAASNRIPDGKEIWHPDIGWRDPDHFSADTWNSIAATTDMARLPLRFWIRNSDGYVMIFWGSALPGHWGFRYSESEPPYQHPGPYGDDAYQQLSGTLAAFYGP